MKEKGALSKLYKMLKSEKKSIIIISLVAIIINIGEAIKPFLIEIVIDDYLSAGIWQNGAMTIGIIGAIYIGIVLLRKCFGFCN